MNTPLPANELDRLQALARYEVLDTPPEPAFDRITALAARIFGVPIALVTLVAEERQWFKAKQGLSICETERGQAFCAHTIMENEVLIVPDATLDPRFADNRLVTGELGVRFYAGAPLITADGFRLGSLCLIDSQARTFTEMQAATLKDLAGMVVETFEARRANANLSAEITERLKAEAALRKSKARKAAILEASLDGIISIDHQGKILELNPAAERMFGLVEADTIGQEMAELIIPPEDRDAHRRGMAHSLATGEGSVLNKRLELHAQRADGSRFPIELCITRIATDGPPVFTGHIRDITERRAVERRLLMLESSLANANDAIIITEAEPINEPGPRIIYVNKAFTKATGYLPEEILGKTPRILQGPNTSPETRRQIRTALEAWQPVRVELINYRKDGSEFWVELNIVPVANQKGWYTHWVSVQRDITERKRTQKEIDDSHQLLRAVIDGTDNIVFLKDLESRYMMINPAGAAILGSTPEEVVGKDDHAFFSPEDARDTQAFDREILRSDRSLTCETTDTIDGVEHVFLSTKSPYRDAAGNLLGVIGIVREITEQRRAAEAEHQAKEEAEKANRAKSEFLSRMSHELRTPLNAILGFGQLLEIGSSLAVRQKESVTHILKAGRHLLGLIDDVLAISRIEAGNINLSLEPVGMCEIIRECLDLVDLQAKERGVKCREGDSGVNAHSFARHVLADRQRLRQVLLNLLSNAIKYNRQDGTVKLSSRELPARYGEETARVRIEVSDTGHGLDAEDIARLFTPFERLKAKQTDTEGTGLGLAVSKSLVEAMQGTIGVESTPGVGSTFWVELPLAIDPRKTADLEDCGPDADLGGDYAATILYVEDNLSNLRLIEMLLDGWPNVKLLSAEQGALGIELARARLPDLILLDLPLPDLPGWEVLEQLRADERVRHIPTVIISADATQGQINRLMAAGANGYLTKPIDVPELMRVIAEHVDSTVATA